MLTIYKKGKSAKGIPCKCCKRSTHEFAIVIKNTRKLNWCWPCTALAFQKQNTSLDTVLRAAELEIRTLDRLGDCDELLDTMRRALNIRT